MSEYIERTCKDCIHYDMCKYRPLAIGVDICDVFRDTADVVPRAEMEQWKILVEAQRKRIDELNKSKAEVARAFRQRMNEKMGKHTHLLGKEYVQRIMREVEKELIGEEDA